MNFKQLKTDFAEGRISKPEFIREAHEFHRHLFDYVEVVRTTDVSEIRIAGDGVSFVIRDELITVLCPAGEARVAPIEVMNFDRYEPHETAVMDILTANAQTIMDVGANIGWYAVRFAKRHPDAAVFAFEPIPTSYRYLQRNVAANGVGSRVNCFNYGLSDSSGPVEFFIAPTNGTNASLRNVADSGVARAITGLTMTMDDWCQAHTVVPDFIKCDVEGAELLVFKGGEQTIERHRPIVFTELLRKWSKQFGYHPNDVIAFFTAKGYSCIAVGTKGARILTEVTDVTEETNYAFVHRESHAGALDALDLRSGHGHG